VNCTPLEFEGGEKTNGQNQRVGSSSLSPERLIPTSLFNQRGGGKKKKANASLFTFSKKKMSFPKKHAQQLGGGKKG